MTDTHQFEVFMKAYQDLVYSTAVRLLGNETDAQDIAQEVFLKAYSRFHELAASGTAGGWLKTVTRNLCLNHLTRYRARWRFFSEMTHTDHGEERELEFAAPETGDAEQTAKDQRQLLEAALRKLPAAQRVPLVLYHFEEMSYEEISTKLRVSLGKVKTDIFRGREALRRTLKLDLEGDLVAEGPPSPIRPLPLPNLRAPTP
jgi:RNA polymerase sigma-70 factor (ECF subfamily)